MPTCNGYSNTTQIRELHPCIMPREIRSNLSGLDHQTVDADQDPALTPGRARVIESDRTLDPDLGRVETIVGAVAAEVGVGKGHVEVPAPGVLREMKTNATDGDPEAQEVVRQEASDKRETE
jgi:hypothetical protein